MSELRPGAFTRDPACEGALGEAAEAAAPRLLEALATGLLARIGGWSPIGLARQLRPPAAAEKDDMLAVELGGVDPCDAIDRIAATLREERVIFTNAGEIKVRMHGGAWTVCADLREPVLKVGIQSHGRDDAALLAAEAGRVLRRAGLID